MFAFTLRKTNVKKTTPTEKIYEAHITRVFIKNGIQVIDYGFENESGLHVHGIVESEKNLINAKFLRIRGWRLHITHLTDMMGWLKYYNSNLLKEKEPKAHEPKAHFEPDSDDLEELNQYHEEFIVPTMRNNLFIS